MDTDLNLTLNKIVDRIKSCDRAYPSISDADAAQIMISLASSTFGQIDGNFPSSGTAEPSPSISDANQEMPSAEFFALYRQFRG